MATLEISLLRDDFGAEIHGLNLSRPLSAVVLAALAQAYLQHKVLLLRDQNLTLEAYTDFARAWGAPRNDAFTEQNVAGFHDLSRLGNTGGLLEQERYRNGSCFWHTDCAAEEQADATTMLYCERAPRSGGETFVADLQAAYTGLKPKMRHRVRLLHAHYSYPGTRPSLDGREPDEIADVEYAEDTLAQLPSVKVRPLVRRHTSTGRKGLYCPAGSIVAIEGLEPEGSAKLLRALKRHATSDKFIYRHRYQPGDLLLWDNAATLHRAGFVGPVGEVGERRIYRIVSSGLPGCL